MKDKEYYEGLDKRSKEYKEYKKGLGDMIASVTKAVGIEPCEGCKKRQDTLNLVGHQLEYFFKKHKPNKFTEQDRTDWLDFINRDKLDKITPIHQETIIRLLRTILNMSVKPCSHCNPKLWEKYTKMIQTVYEQDKE